ncbi:MAG: dihydropteroate synthase [Bacteroidota bacterium]|nr:dihydropteroate synthase [Bacteroidota bacterium]
MMIPRTYHHPRRKGDECKAEESARTDSPAAPAAEWPGVHRGRLSEMEDPRNLPFPSHGADDHTLLVGERCNTDGSKRFRALFLARDFEGIAEISARQVREGAQMLDVRVSIPGRNEREDVSEIVRFLRTRVGVPLMIDTTEPEAAEAALADEGENMIINSVDFADGEKRVEEFLRLCRRYGSSLVTLTIDEDGPAVTVERKRSIVRRMREHARRLGVDDDRLIFDPLVFALVSFSEQADAAATETLEAVRWIKERFPRCRTCLGVSNVSHGLAPQVRGVFETVFLRHASAAGLDLAIVNTRRLKTAPWVGERVRETAEHILFGGMDRTEALPLLRSPDLFTAG